MIEQSIYFALGCIVTALLALGFAPIFWSRALRLTRKRLQLQVPLSMQEILADRDQLRAGFAVERLRLEQAMERIKETKAADMAAIGRLTVAAARHAEEIAALRRIEGAQGREIGLLMREAAEAGTEMGALKKALDDAQATGERHRRYAEWADGEHERLRHDLADRAAMVEALESRRSKRRKEPRPRGIRASETGCVAGLRRRCGMPPGTRRAASPRAANSTKPG